MKQLKALWVILILLNGCATVAGTGAVSGVSENRLSKITEADLNAAIKQASDNNDPQAVLCYTEIKNFIAKVAAPELKGVLSTFETARLLRRRIQSNDREPLHVACAPLIVDANVTLAKLGLIAAGL